MQSGIIFIMEVLVQQKEMVLHVVAFVICHLAHSQLAQGLLLDHG